MQAGRNQINCYAFQRIKWARRKKHNRRIDRKSIKMNGWNKKPKRYSHTQICCVSLFVFFGDVSFCWVLFLLSLFHFTILSSPGQKPPKYYCTHTKNLICVLTTTDSTANEEKTSNERKKRLYKELYLKNNFARDFFSSFFLIFFCWLIAVIVKTRRERECIPFEMAEKS